MVALKTIVRGHQRARREVARVRKAQRKETDAQIRKATFRAEKLVKRLYSGPMLKTRSGTLRRSVHHVLKSADDGLRASVGTPTKYALTHEKGGVIRPTFRGGRSVVVGRLAGGQIKTKTSKGRMLAIPVGPAKTPAGVAKHSKIDQTALTLSKGKPFSTFVSQSGKAIMLSVRGGGVQPIAALKSRVRIPKRAVWDKVFRHIRRRLPADIAEGISKQTRKAA